MWDSAKLRTMIAAGAFLLVVATSSCASHSHGDAGVPKKRYLRARVASLYEAEVAGDWRSWFQMTTVYRNDEMSYSDFVKEVGAQEPRPFTILSWRFRRIRPESTPSDWPNSTAAARVEMDVVIEEPGQSPEKVDDQTDYWVLIDNEWYWTWRGFPSD
jgi:hypothetical protein